ncbi:MAG: histidine kinase [Bacteroidota bacterium]
MTQEAVIGMIVGLLLMVLIWIFLLSYRATAQRKQEESQKQMYDQLRARLGKDLHDELGSRLAAMQWYGHMLRKSHSNNQQEKYARKLEVLANETYVGLRDLLWMLDPGKDRWIDLLTALKRLGQDLFGDTIIAFEFTQALPDEILQKTVLPDQQRHVLLLFREAFANILKHAEADRVSMKWHWKEGVMQGVLTNNGTSNNTLQPHGQGLENMLFRAQQLEATLELEQREQETEVRFYWPLSSFRRQQ